MFLSTATLTKYLKDIGRRSVFLFGVFMNATSLLLLTLVVYFDYTGAIVLSLVSRTIAGFGTASIMVPSFAIIASDFPNDI